MGPKLTLAAALAALDARDDAQWTEDGLPRLDLLSTLTGSKVTREQATAAAPSLTRASALAGAQAGVGAGTTATAAPTPPQAPTGGNDGALQTPGSGPAESDAGGQDGQAAAQEDQLAVAKRAYEHAVQVKAQADRDVAEKSAALDRLIEARDAATPHSTLDTAIRDYHAAQLRDRQRRAEQIAALKGVNLKDILPQRAPIDQAFKNRPRR